MQFNFFGLVRVTTAEGDCDINRFFVGEFDHLSSDASGLPYSIVVEFDATLNAQRLQPSVVVGGTMFCCGNEYFISDGSDRLSEWPIGECGGDRIVVRTHPDFKGYRFYFYVLLPLLKQLLNRHGLTFLHSSAVRFQDRVILFSGWGGTGKTNILLQYAASGGVYLADDLVVISRDGMVYPFPRKLNLFDYNLAAFPALNRYLSKRQRIKIASVKRGASIVRRILRSHAFVVDVVRKRMTNVVLRPDAISESIDVRPQRGTTIVLLYAGTGNPAKGVGALDGVERALLANVRYEFHPIQELMTMRSFLSGSAAVTTVNDLDVDIVKSFLKRVPARVMVVGPGRGHEEVMADIERMVEPSA